jgi:hypothetical protein
MPVRNVVKIRHHFSNNLYSHDPIRHYLLERLDYAVMVKHFATPPGQVEAKRRYSPAPFVGVSVRVKAGNPRPDRICTSHVERQNLTLRHFNKRFSRLALGYSKTLINHRYAIALFVCAYNFCKVHGTMGCTPAVAVKLASKGSDHSFVHLPSCMRFPPSVEFGGQALAAAHLEPAGDLGNRQRRLLPQARRQPQFLRIALGPPAQLVFLPAQPFQFRRAGVSPHF